MMFSRWKIKPIDGSGVTEEQPLSLEMRQKPKSRLRHILERPFSLKSIVSRDLSPSKEFEPNSICLRKMVENFIEDPDNVKQQRCGGHNKFNYFSVGGIDYSSDEEEPSCGEDLQEIMNLISSTNTIEKTLIEKATQIVEEDDTRCLMAGLVKKRKQESGLKAVVDGLVALGYDAAICKLHLEKSKISLYSSPGGDYQYLDVLIGGERVLIDIDFKSKFEIARPTDTYKSILNTLPDIFVGELDRLKKIVGIMSEAAKKSFKMTGLYMAPWRTSKSVLSKWVSPYDRGNQRQEGISFKAKIFKRSVANSCF